MNVRISAWSTNIENVRVSRMFADKPTLSTMSSTKLHSAGKLRCTDAQRKVTHPLQLMRVPMADDSRMLKPVSFAVMAHPRNLEKKATTQMRTT